MLQINGAKNKVVGIFFCFYTFNGSNFSLVENKELMQTAVFYYHISYFRKKIIKKINRGHRGGQITKLAKFGISNQSRT